MLGNFNPTTAYQTFPTLSIDNIEAQTKSSPTLGDPGFIVEFTDGSWEWKQNLGDAKVLASAVGAIYAATDVCDYYKQFAEEAHIDPKTGKETFTGMMPE